MQSQHQRSKSGEYLVSEVKRRKGESFDSLLRRFSRKVQQSGKLLQVRKIRYHASPKSKNANREAALRREYLRARKEYLLKTGQAVEEDFKPKRGNRR